MSSRGRLIWGGLASLVLLFVGVKWTQQWLFSRALRTSVSAIGRLDAELPKRTAADSREPGYFFPLFPFGDPAALHRPTAESSATTPEPSASSPRGAPASPSRRKEPNEMVSGEPPIGPEPKSARASSQTVLGWANAQVMPRGRSVSEEHGLSAGIEIFDAGGFGLGILDGDRLVAVDGSPVSDQTDVVGLVLAARGREQKEIVATMMRRTESGPARYSVVLEQPYLSWEELVALQESQVQKSAEGDEGGDSSEVGGEESAEKKALP